MQAHPPELVAMLFSDIEGSTDLVNRLGDDWLTVLVRQRELCRTAWEAWRGDELGTEGDSFFVAFADPADAIQAALQAQAAVAAEDWPAGEEVRIRMGIHYGPAVRHENGLVGADVHRAARVSSAAHGGQVLVSGVVEEAVRDRAPTSWRILDLGEHQLRGLAHPERLVQVAAGELPDVFPPPRISGAGEGALVGVGDYRFLRSMGESAHGELYLAVPPARLGIAEPFVTVKVVPGADDEDTLRRMTRELRTFAAVGSPYLVKLLDAGRQRDLFFYAMEYCPLGSLAVPQRPITATEATHAVADAARAAQALHDAGLVHRGVRPANVLLAEDGGRLGDFGRVREQGSEDSITSLGMFSGLEYVEARQLAGEQPTPASDVFGLAATLHWALTGEGVYGVLPTGDPLLAVRRILTRPPRVSEALGPGVRELVTDALLSEPESRPTAGVFAARLEGR